MYNNFKSNDQLGIQTPRSIETNFTLGKNWGSIRVKSVFNNKFYILRQTKEKVAELS